MSVKIEEFRSALAGGSFFLLGTNENNRDGSSRSDSLEKTQSGELVALIMDPFAQKIVHVEARTGCIGILSEPDSAEVFQMFRGSCGIKAKIECSGPSGVMLSARKKLTIHVTAHMPAERIGGNTGGKQ